MRASPIALLMLASAVGVAATGCEEATFSVPTLPVGVLSVFARSQGAAYVVRPEGVFVLAGSAPTSDSRSTVDTCQLGDYVPTTTIPGVEHVDAGDSLLFFAAGSGITVLRPVSQFGVIVYAAVPRDLDFAPGAEVRFTIPGASGGFPATEITSLTPSAIDSLTPIPSRPSLDQALTLTWEPVGDDSSRFEVLLIYATQGTTTFNQQVVCEWRDDGSGAIRPELLGGWALSEVQRVEVTRYRTQSQQIGDNVLFLLATFDTVPQVVP